MKPGLVICMAFGMLSGVAGYAGDEQFQQIVERAPTARSFPKEDAKKIKPLPTSQASTKAEEEKVEGQPPLATEAAPQRHAPSGGLSRYWNGFVEGLSHSIFGVYFNDLNRRMGSAAHLDQENELLRKKVAELEADHAKLEQLAESCHEETRATLVKHEAVEEGGLESSRTLASLKTADEHLLSKPPKVVFEQALTSFNEGDYETAAKALTFLADNADNDAFQTTRVFLLAGVSLYKVGNYKTALKFLGRAENDSGGESLSYAPRALGWMALCYKKLGDLRAEKKTVFELIQRYPKSKEARRLNANS